MEPRARESWFRRAPPSFGLVFSPDGRRLAWAQGNVILLSDVATGHPVARLPGDGLTMSLAFSPDGTRLASGSENRTIQVWDLATSKLLATLRGHSGGILSLTLHPNDTSSHVPQQPIQPLATAHHSTPYPPLPKHSTKQPPPPPFSRSTVPLLHNYQSTQKQGTRTRL